MENGEWTPAEREKKREEGTEGPHSKENTKRLGLVGVGDISNYSERGREGERGRSPKSSRADYAGMTSHFSLHIEREGQREVPSNPLDGLLNR